MLFSLPASLPAFPSTRPTVGSRRLPPHRLLLLLLPLWMVLAWQPVAAQQNPAVLNVISDTALSNASGRIGVNTTAGTANAQSNAAAIGVSHHAGSGIGSADLMTQQETAPLLAGQGAASRGNEEALIRGQAFHAVQGLVSVNQSSGSMNTQANLIALGAGTVAEVAVDQLMQVSSPPSSDPATLAAALARHQKSEIADTAFAGAQGIVQVSQLAGQGNRSANVFALSVSSALP